MAILPAAIVIAVLVVTRLPLLSRFGGDRHANRSGAPRVTSRALKSTSDLQFTDLEWQAIRIALNDASGRCGADARGTSVGAVFRRLTGAQPLQPLANPRLEELRQFTCHIRRYRFIDTRLAESLQQYGFNPRQVEALAALSS